MIQRLIILGVLKNKPSSGYDIKKFIEKELGIYSALQLRSIYYPLKQMEKENLIRKRTILGEKHLKKFIYNITPKGEKEFINLCNQMLLSQQRPFIDLDIPLYFLTHLDKREVIARLRLRKRFLKKARIWLLGKIKKEPPTLSHHQLLLKHSLNLLNAEERFVREIINNIKINLK